MIINELIGSLELLLLVVVGLIFSASFCGMVYLCIQNLRFILSYREDLKKRIDGLRIHRMLDCLGMSPMCYIRKVRHMEVEVLLNRCKHCPNTAVCDAALDTGDTSQADTFCPDFPELIRFSHPQ
ncbi:MAG: hypothetical protein ABFR65_03435 [Pseudomonadota bacterium]